MEDPEIYERDIVKWEVLKYFGAFVSESSIHFSEYVPYFRRTPALIDQHASEKMWGNMRKGQTSEDRWASVLARRAKEEKEHRRLARSDDEIPVERSHEYCARIMNAIETNVPYVFNGNIPNTHQPERSRARGKGLCRGESRVHLSGDTTRPTHRLASLSIGDTRDGRRDV